MEHEDDPSWSTKDSLEDMDDLDSNPSTGEQAMVFTRAL